jgi:hypothetical protein
MFVNVKVFQEKREMWRGASRLWKTSDNSGAEFECDDRLKEVRLEFLLVHPASNRWRKDVSISASIERRYS